MPETITEYKRHLNKPDQSYVCEVLTREPGHVVLRYVSDREGRIGEAVFPPGSTTVAHYWTGRGFVAWRMHGPDGRLIGHVFHICRDVKIEQGRVDYLDLLLDLWVSPEGEVRILDEDEVAACRDRGVLCKADLEWIELQRRQVIERLPNLLREVG